MSSSDVGGVRADKGSLVRAFTLKRKVFDNLSTSNFLSRSASQRPAKSVERPQISSPMALTASSNPHLAEMIAIVGKIPREIRAFPSTESISTTADDSDEGKGSGESSGPSSLTDASSIESSSPVSPGPNHLSCYFNPNVDTDLSLSQSRRKASINFASNAPKLPDRIPSHSKSAHEYVHRHRSFRRGLDSTAPSPRPSIESRSGSTSSRSPSLDSPITALPSLASRSSISSKRSSFKPDFSRNLPDLTLKRLSNMAPSFSLPPLYASYGSPDSEQNNLSKTTSEKSATSQASASTVVVERKLSISSERISLSSQATSATRKKPNWEEAVKFPAVKTPKLSFVNTFSLGLPPLYASYESEITPAPKPAVEIKKESTPELSRTVSNASSKVSAALNNFSIFGSSTNEETESRETMPRPSVSSRYSKESQPRPSRDIPVRPPRELSEALSTEFVTTPLIPASPAPTIELPSLPTTSLPSTPELDPLSRSRRQTMPSKEKHPFGQEIAQLDTVAEEYSHSRGYSLDTAAAYAEVAQLKSHGLAIFTAADYSCEIQPFSYETYPIQEEETMTWI